MSESVTWFLSGFFLAVSMGCMITALVWDRQRKG